MPFALPKDFNFADWADHKEFLPKQPKFGLKFKELVAAAKSCDTKSPDYVTVLHDAMVDFLEITEAAFGYAKKTKDFPPATMDWLKLLLKLAKAANLKIDKLISGVEVEEEEAEEEPVYENQSTSAAAKPSAAKPSARANEPVYENQSTASAARPAAASGKQEESNYVETEEEENDYQNDKVTELNNGLQRAASVVDVVKVLNKGGVSTGEISAAVKANDATTWTKLLGKYKVAKASIQKVVDKVVKSETPNLGPIPGIDPKGTPWPAYLDLAKKARLDVGQLRGASGFLALWQSVSTKRRTLDLWLNEETDKMSKGGPVDPEILKKARTDVAGVVKDCALVKVAVEYEKVVSKWNTQYRGDPQISVLVSRMFDQIGIFMTDLRDVDGYQKVLGKWESRLANQVQSQKEQEEDASAGPEVLWARLASATNAIAAGKILQALKVPTNEIDKLVESGSPNSVRVLLEKYNAPEDVIKKVVGSNVLLP